MSSRNGRGNGQNEENERIAQIETSQPTDMLKVDLHSHTRHSPDAALSPARLVERARQAGLDRIAVTDHDAIDGALRARELAPETVIVGQEISCTGGVELIGLFLEDRIPLGLSVREVADRIRAQGGLVYAPHPFAYLLDRDRRGRALIEAADLVEAVNARAFWPAWNRTARQVARERQLPRCAGSDAHFAREVGRAFTRMPAFRTAGEFRAALTGAEPVLRRTTSPVNHVRSAALRAARYATPGLRGSKGPRPDSGDSGESRDERRIGVGTAGTPGRAAGAGAGEGQARAPAEPAEARDWMPPVGEAPEGASGARKRKVG